MDKMVTRQIRTEAVAASINIQQSDPITAGNRDMLRAGKARAITTTFVFGSLLAIARLERSGNTTAAPLLGMTTLIIGDIGDHLAERFLQRGKERLSAPGSNKPGDVEAPKEE